MADTLETVWPAEPHTLAKHDIITSYLGAWLHIMSHQNAKMRPPRDIFFIDGFAGPGVYTGGEDGSPVLAIKAAINHDHCFPTPIHYLFIEKDADRCAILRENLNRMSAAVQGSGRIAEIHLEKGDCAQVLSSEIDHYTERGRKFGPALVFLDQFGYSDVPMSLIEQVMSCPQCEVFTYLNYSGLNRFFTDPTKDAARTAAFGTEEWREAAAMDGWRRQQFLLKLYKHCLARNGGTSYVWDFAMADADGRPLYWLFFCTQNIRGLEEMKRAMWSVDKTGGFRFSDDSNPDQLQLLEMFGDNWLADFLPKRLAGQRMAVGQLKTYVLTETPCYKYANVMKTLVKEGKVTIQADTKKISFLNDLDAEIRFADKELF